MLLIVGKNMGQGKHLSMELTKRSLYAAFLTTEEVINTYKTPIQAKPRSLRRIKATSMDYYMELYREELEEKTVTDPWIAFPRLILLMSDIGETAAETVISIMNKRTEPHLLFAICDDPSAYFPYMNSCHTIFTDKNIEEILKEIHFKLLDKNINLLKIRVGHLCLYEDEKDAYLFGKKLYLTSSEYRILRFLSFHEGIPFNAESIMSYCFPSTFARKKSNAITHICHINAKTKKLTENTIISCKKNVGYYVIKK